MLCKKRSVFQDMKYCKELIDEDTALANIDEVCPYCFNIEGFKVIGKVAPMEEVVAETNALTNTYTDEPVEALGTRLQYLQQHFPKTIAAIKDAMNWKDDLTAIEYFGKKATFLRNSFAFIFSFLVAFIIGKVVG